MVRIEQILFDGTPAIFYDVAKAFETECATLAQHVEVDLQAPVRTVQTPDREYTESAITPGSGRVVVVIYNGADGPLFIEAVVRPDQKTQIKAHSSPEIFDKLESLWSALVEYLSNQGWISNDNYVRQARKRGPKGLACNVWIDHLVNAKNYRIGSNSENNELFQMWKKLWSFENGKNADDPSILDDPWESFRKAAGKK